MVVVAGNLTLDDTVLPDGTTTMDIVGGAALYTAFGAALWHRPVGLVCRRGDDFPQAALATMAAAGLHVDGVVHHPGPTNRFWTIYEWDGRRHFILRTTPQRYLELAPEPEDLPAAYAGMALLHLAAMPPGNVQRFVAHATRLQPAPRLTLDTHEGYIAGYQDVLATLLPRLQAFLPSREEVALWFGDDDPEGRIGDLLALGPRAVVIKMGADGALVQQQGEARPRLIPALPVPVIDATGAGDAFCGGFGAATAHGAAPFEAALAATVSASFAVESRGSLALASVQPAARDERLYAIREKAHGH